jgi:hypothetical protein
MGRSATRGVDLISDVDDTLRHLDYISFPHSCTAHHIFARATVAMLTVEHRAEA